MGFLSSIFFFIIILSIIFKQFLLHHQPVVVAATDVLKPGEELNSLNTTSTLISANGKFTLGFFTIPSTNFTYLGIWYTETHQGVKVWVANHDIPMIGDGVLIIDDSGTLKIINGSGTSIFTVSNDQVGSGNKTRALLQDSGNFLVYDELENRTIWQSFDHPTDTLLPGMKIGYNLTTKQNWTLTSWLSDQVPGTGAFKMRLEQYQNTTQLLIYRRGEVYWTSGPWDKDIGNFQLPSTYFKSPISFQHNGSLISDASGIYFTFQTIVSASSMVQLSPNGQIIEFIDGVNHFNLTPEFCYGYQYHGCAASSSALPNCRRESDSFELKSGDWIGGSSNYDDTSSFISLIDCMEKCWNDCNCTGFTTTNSYGTGCRTWGGDQPFRVDETAQTTRKYVLVLQKPHKKNTWIWILVSLASVLISVLRFCLVSWKQKKKKRDDYDQREMRGEGVI